MELSNNIGKILITISTVIYGFIPPIADFNKTHATNPKWIGHARFHVVWQVLITFFIAIYSLYYLWFKKTPDLLIPFINGLIVLGSFLLNVFLKKYYSGKLADDNGIPKYLNIDSNLLGFSIALILLILGFYLAIN
jgi:hypothetical protein